MMNPRVTFTAILLVIFAFCGNLFAQNNQNAENARRLMDEVLVTIKAKKFDEVIEQTTRLIGMYPTFGEPYIFRAIAYQKTNNEEAAIRDLSVALTTELNPSLELTAHNLRGALLYRAKRYDPAIKDFDFVINRETADFRIYGFRGFCYFFKGNYNAAIADFDAALKINPQETSLRLLRARAHYYLGNYEKTVADIDDELTINQSPVRENYLFRSLAYRKLGKNDLAEKDEQRFFDSGGKPDEIEKAKNSKITESKPVYDETKIRAMRESIFQSVKERNFDGAFKEVEELIKNVPGEVGTKTKSQVLAARAADYYKAGDVQKSLEDLNEAIKLDPGFALAYQVRAVVYRKLGKIKEAEADDAKAAALGAGKL